MRARLEAATDSWVDGRVTAGYQGAPVKHNQQIAEGSPIAREMGDLIIGALERNPLFISAVLPNRVYPPLFNRYEGGMHFGSHVDGAIRIVPGHGARVRTDVSITLFLSPPEEYDGGELVHRGYVWRAGSEAARRTRRRLSGDEPASGAPRHARRARVELLLGAEPRARRRGAARCFFDLDTAIQRLNAAPTSRTPHPRRVLSQPAAHVERHVGFGFAFQSYAALWDRCGFGSGWS